MTREYAIGLLTAIMGHEPYGSSVSTALSMAIAALREQPRWISVEELLPKYNADVLVYRPSMAMKILVASYDGYYGEDDNEWYEGWSAFGKDSHGNSVITHWMPLPSPPTEGENG